MKGVICAGGNGTRLYPLTRATNKHLLPIFDMPMIFYPIATLVNAGIEEVLIITGGNHAGDFINVLRNGKEFGLKEVKYAYQEPARSGIADAISYAEDFADGDSIAVILGDNTTDADISTDVQNFSTGAKVFLKEVPDPERYGVPVFDENKNIVEIEEKPEKPKSNYSAIGLYMYDSKVFDIIRGLEPSARGEYEVTGINNVYINNGEMSWTEIKDFWSDAGTFESLFDSGAYWAEKKRNQK
jgi:glucose-1-phosphate thymidylyltransferase